MKYNTIIVPVMVAALAAAAATERTRKTDQGAYRPQPQAKESFPSVGSNAPVPMREDSSRTPAGGEQGEMVPAPVRKAPGEAPQPGSVPAQAMGAAEGAHPASVPSQAKDKAEDAHVASAPSEAMHEGESYHPGDFAVVAPQPVGERHTPQPPRMRRSRIHATRAEVSESCGIMRVQASDPAYSGYVSEQRDDSGRYTVISDKSKGVVTKFKAHNIVPSNGEGYDVLGATFGAVHDDAGDEQLRGNSGNFAMLTGTSKTLYGKGPATGRSSFNDAVKAHQRIESAVYSMGENGEIHPSWVDKDGVSTPATWGVNDQKQLVYSANIGQYVADFGGKSAQVFCLF